MQLTKVCIDCHNELPIDKFRLYDGKYRAHKCHRCRNPRLAEEVVNPNGFHVCRICKKRQKRKSFQKNNRSKIGIYNTCKNCIGKYKKSVGHRYAEQAKITMKKNMLKRKYNITIQDLNKMLQEQDFRCEICLRHYTELKQQRLFVDHDHKSDKVRGLLCPSCNRLLGLALDSKQTLLNALKYLNKYDS